MSLLISGCKTMEDHYIFIGGGIDVKSSMKKRCMASVLALVMMCLLGACGTDKADTKLYQKESKETDSSSTQDNTSEDKSADDSEAGDMTVHFLDVGQGLSILVQSEGQTMIYDGGDRSTSSFVVSYLKEQNVSKIDYLISSHYDSDHMAGLIGCLNAFEVDHVISSDYVHDSKLYTSFVNTVDEKGLEMEHPAVGTTFSFGSGSFQILAPAEIDPNGSNNNSVAIKLTNGNNSFIFTGDAEVSSEAAMCNSGIDLDCDVLVPGHHGSATATSWDFLQKTVPEYAVISCGQDNQYGHPDKDTMDKLESMDIQVYRTDKQGTITVTSDGTNLTWSTEPCNDYTPGDAEDQGTQAVGSESKAESSESAQSQAVQSQTTDTQDVGTVDQVWVSATGSKYHSRNNCGTMNPDAATQMSRSEAEAKGLTPCKKCY